MKVDLDKIDRLRARVDLTYEEAAAYLEAAGGDLVQALVMVERDMGDSVEDSLNDRGSEAAQFEDEDSPTWMWRLTDAVRRGSSMRIVVERDGANVARLPATAGLVGAIFAPELTAVGAILALATSCTLRLERSQSD